MLDIAAGLCVGADESLRGRCAVGVPRHISLLGGGFKADLRGRARGDASELRWPSRAVVRWRLGVALRNGVRGVKSCWWPTVNALAEVQCVELLLGGVSERDPVWDLGR